MNLLRFFLFYFSQTTQKRTNKYNKIQLSQNFVTKLIILSNPKDQLLWRLCFENANLSREHKLTQEMSKIMEHEFDRANKKTRILDLELDKAMTRIQQLEEMLIALQGEKVDEDTKR